MSVLALECDRIEDVIDRVRAYHETADVDLLQRAYEFSARAHEGQQRLSGEPYLQHPLAVASILCALRLDVPPIAAGLLHDVVEDTVCTSERLEEEFGEEIARLVDGVTKIGKVEFKSDEEKQAENFRKMLLSMADDIRVIIIKLADRLHNMQTLSHLDPTRKAAIARETLEIYAPLANRLGMGWIRNALEDLCLKTLQPEKYDMLRNKVAKRFQEREAYVDEVTELVSQKLLEHGIKAEITGRPKHLYSIYQKMETQGISFEEVYDLTAIRVATDTLINCYGILGIVHSLWQPVPGRFKDYIGGPKSNLYQSLHTTVVGPSGEHVEFQIRTEAMHRVAEEGIAAHWRYKDKGNVNTNDEKIFTWLRQLVEWHRDLSDNRQFMNSVKLGLYADVIYVFTPEGDVKELPAGATPVDFAYAVHTEVGHHCLGAKVNGKIVPLSTTLHSGDSVRILTSSTRLPSKGWLKFVQTPSAKTKIKHWIRDAEWIRNVEIGKRMVEKEMRRQGMAYSEFMKRQEFLVIAKHTGFQSSEELVGAVSVRKISAEQVVKRMMDETHGESGVDQVKAFPHAHPEAKPQDDQSVKIRGISGLLFHFSRCCNPVPGDHIFGFITRGRGISIHASGCPNLDVLECHKERFVDVEWDLSCDRTHHTGISVLTVNQPGLLASVSSTITAGNVNITSADIAVTHDAKAAQNYVVEVRNASQLERVIKSIEELQGVFYAKRVPGRPISSQRFRRSIPPKS